MKIVHKEAVFLNGDIEVFGLYHPDTEEIEINVGSITEWVNMTKCQPDERRVMLGTLIRLVEYHEMAHWAQDMLGLEFDEMQADLMAVWRFIAQHKYIPFQWSRIPNPLIGRSGMLLEYKPKEANHE